MAIQVQIGGVWKTMTACKVFASGAWRDAVALRIHSGAAWRLITFSSSGGGGGGGGGAMSVSIAPSPFTFADNASRISGLLTATPSSGVSPFSYAWSITGDSGSATLTGTGFATATLTSTPLGAWEIEGVTVRCVVTDDLGNTAHADVDGTFRRK